jgi:hypothetical protein
MLFTGPILLETASQVSLHCKRTAESTSAWRRTRGWLRVVASAAAILFLHSNATAVDRATNSERPPAVEFLGATNGFGVKQIKTADVPLLVDDAAGFYLIGSATGTDDRNNIASFVKNTDGALHSMNGATKVSLPYSFTVEPDAKEKNKLAFKISLGPATMSIATVSMPVDGHRKLFTSYRYEGAKKIERFDQNPDHYKPLDRGQYNIRFAPGQPKWGEMIGPDFTVRVTITKSSRPMSLAFVDAPSLSTGVRNVEFGFGALKVGERATATGHIQVFKTDRALLKLIPGRDAASNDAK